MSQRWEPQTPRDHGVMDVLRAIRALGDAMDRMHSGMKGDMDMNATDVAALRMLIMREQRGETVSPHDLADHLRISTASTTKLLDRLTSSGHLERRPHPHDRRARVVVLTQQSRDDFYKHMGERLRAMRGVTDGYDEAELRVVTRFLLELSEAIDPAE
ncbi:MarR family transcriptional regulator [Microbacterium sp. NPDC019599]|uniref:MarR family winged helix-turn-helix transcriptional regulator n=1 Tax=Microbacterium sp. NPDC019599 TaxID=3154690 RepID=UPI0033CEE988